MIDDLLQKVETNLVSNYLKISHEMNFLLIDFFVAFFQIDKSPVILTVSRVRSDKMQRSPSISVGTPTPLAQRSSITAPLPVDVSIFSMRNYQFDN